MVEGQHGMSAFHPFRTPATRSRD